jgi:hypothetical protein
MNFFCNIITVKLKTFSPSITLCICIRTIKYTVDIVHKRVADPHSLYADPEVVF